MADRRFVLQSWSPARTAVIICDMWDAHHCVSAARRGAEMAPRMNSVVGALRDSGAFVIHAPGDCMQSYADSPARVRATQERRAHASVAIGWNDWTADEKASLPATLTDPGPCSCESAEPCGDGRPPYPWTRQTSLLDIAQNDAISDDGREIFNLLEAREIADVLIMGVHTNICVLGRPYGIRQLARLGKRPALCRDLTDSFHRDPRGHEWGTGHIVDHIERRWCPVVTSDQLVGGEPFRFRR